MSDFSDPSKDTPVPSGGSRRCAGARKTSTADGGRVRKVTERYLENAALYYLERFATSAANLRAVLMRKVLKSARYHGTDPTQGEAWVDALIARFCASGLLDDRAYGAARVATLRRRGNSARAIRAKLMQKGVDGAIIEAALDSHGRDEGARPEEEELAAAVRLARRRRLGPFAPADVRAARRDRDLAALARAGFSYDVAHRVIDAATVEDITL